MVYRFHKWSEGSTPTDFICSIIYSLFVQNIPDLPVFYLERKASEDSEGPLEVSFLSTYLNTLPGSVEGSAWPSGIGCEEQMLSMFLRRVCWLFTAFVTIWK